ncbi:MAG: HD domain-containing phosphohydrolase [Pseudomonadota bacterium]
MVGSKVLAIQFLGRENIKKAISKTLLRAYPNLQINLLKNEADINKDVDVVIIDTCSIPEKQIRKLIVTLTDTPVLLVVADINQVKNFQGLISGRRDIITEEELNSTAIIRSVGHLKERQQLHQQITKTAYRLKEASTRDELTHLYNFHYFNEIILQEVKKANRYKRSLGLIIMDFNNFSALNNKLGPHEADRILANTSSSICSTIREVDIAARFGDNSFAILLPETTLRSSIKAAERIFKAICKNSQISLGLGVSALGKNIKTCDDLIRTALAALTLSKKKNEICTNLDLEENHQPLREDRQLIEELNREIMGIGLEAERNAFQATLKVINNIPQHKKYLVRHAERVAFYAEQLAKKIDADNGLSKVAYRGGLLHDIGLLAIENRILIKSDKLSIAERELLQKHTFLGTQIIKGSPFLSQELELIACHHERYDGNGYPAGLKGEEIPLGARIIGLTEAWDAMINEQPYRPRPLSPDQALIELNKESGRQFDPNIVDLFTSLIKD